MVDVAVVIEEKPYRVSIRIIISILGKKMIDDFRKNRDDTRNTHHPSQALPFCYVQYMYSTYYSHTTYIIHIAFRESGSNHFPARQPSLCQVPRVPLQTNVDRCIVRFVVFCFDHRRCYCCSAIGTY